MSNIRSFNDLSLTLHGDLAATKLDSLSAFKAMTGQYGDSKCIQAMMVINRLIENQVFGETTKNQIITKIHDLTKDDGSFNLSAFTADLAKHYGLYLEWDYSTLVPNTKAQEKHLFNILDRAGIALPTEGETPEENLRMFVEERDSFIIHEMIESLAILDALPVADKRAYYDLYAEAWKQDPEYPELQEITDSLKKHFGGQIKDSFTRLFLSDDDYNKEIAVKLGDTRRRLLLRP